MLTSRIYWARAIEAWEQRGRTVDVHALRHTFGTHLSKVDVAPRTAQAAMRHSSIDLTMNVYTDPRLLDIHGAVERLPDLPLEGTTTTTDAATGTDGADAESGPRKFAPTADNQSHPSQFLTNGAPAARASGTNQEGKKTRENDGSLGVLPGDDEWAIQDSNTVLKPE